MSQSEQKLEDDIFLLEHQVDILNNIVIRRDSVNTRRYQIKFNGESHARGSFADYKTALQVAAGVKEW